MRRFILLASIAAPLAGCGGPDGQPAKITNRTEEVAVASAPVPANLPAYAKVYPGANVTSSVALGDKGGAVTYDVKAAPEAVMDFYKASAAQAKLTDSMDSWRFAEERSGAHVMVFNEPGTQRSLSASVQSEGGVTKVALTYGAP